jgi:hypothetical protein
MIKKLTILLLLFGLVAFFRVPVFAANEKIVDVFAEIPTNSPQIDVVILKIIGKDTDSNPWTDSTEENSMDFGELTYFLDDGSNAGAFFSKAGYCVVIFTQPFGNPYEIRSNCLGLNHELGLGVINPYSFGLTPVYSEKDKFVYPGGSTAQGTMPDGAQIGPAGSAVGNKLIYSSEPGTGTARIIQAYYGLPPYDTGGALPFPGYEPIELTQVPGKYKGQVTITISIK